MRIKSITLENIRSYGNKKINFPEGSTLLSGNIGSGKTSLLLAIDFVLFGLRKGNLSGNGLLRKGKDEGFVELNFEINEKDIIIRRNLKKSKDKINQISGFFSVNSKTSPKIFINSFLVKNIPLSDLRWVLYISGSFFNSE